VKRPGPTLPAETSARTARFRTPARDLVWVRVWLPGRARPGGPRRRGGVPKWATCAPARRCARHALRTQPSALGTGGRLSTHRRHELDVLALTVRGGAVRAALDLPTSRRLVLARPQHDHHCQHDRAHYLRRRPDCPATPFPRVGVLRHCGCLQLWRTARARGPPREPVRGHAESARGRCGRHRCRPRATCPSPVAQGDLRTLARLGRVLAARKRRIIIGWTSLQA
jgi:hypothetical protein